MVCGQGVIRIRIGSYGSALIWLLGSRSLLKTWRIRILLYSSVVFHNFRLITYCRQVPLYQSLTSPRRPKVIRFPKDPEQSIADSKTGHSQKYSVDLFSILVCRLMIPVHSKMSVHISVVDPHFLQCGSGSSLISMRIRIQGAKTNAGLDPCQMFRLQKDKF